MWAEFLDKYNGRSLVLEGLLSKIDCELYMDASSAQGFGVFFQGEWCSEGRPATWLETGHFANLALELFPKVVAVKIWGDRLKNKRVRFLCDNIGMVQHWDRQTANSLPIVCLL